MTRTRLLVLLAAGYVGLAILANWLASKWIVPVGFGFVAPAGVFAIGGVLVLRDWIQQATNVVVVALLMLAAAGASYGIAELAGWTGLEKIALASLAAFVVSETVEMLVFTPLRKKSLTAGVLLSGTAGIALDSYVFLSLAFGSLAFFDGQMIGKGWALAAGVALTATRRRLAPVVCSASSVTVWRLDSVTRAGWPRAFKGAGDWPRKPRT